MDITMRTRMFLNPNTKLNQLYFMKEAHDKAIDHLREKASTEIEKQHLGIMESRKAHSKIAYKVLPNFILATEEERAENPRFREQFHFSLVYAEWALWYPLGAKHLPPTVPELSAALLSDLNGVQGWDPSWVATRIPEKEFVLLSQLMKLFDREKFTRDRPGMPPMKRHDQWRLVDLANTRREVQKHFGVPSEYTPTVDFVEQLSKSPLITRLMFLHETLCERSRGVEIPASSLTGFFVAYGAILMLAIEEGPIAIHDMLIGNDHWLARSYQKCLKELWCIDSQHGTKEHPLMPEAWEAWGQMAQDEWVMQQMTLETL